MRAAAALVLIIAACGGRTETPAPPPQTAAAQNVVAAAAEDDYVPAEAHALGEQVVSADFNRDKTTRLQMKITTLVGRTSALSGFSTALAAREEKIDDRLARLQARVSETEIVIQLPGSILFDFDSAAIRPDAERALEDVRQVIASYTGRPVRIEGHTDSMAGDDYNQKLSERRAASVAQWLQSHGVEAARLTTSGLGESKPVATNETSGGRQKNRRVEIIIARQ
ncbi:MAG TPA: OmpA family protein [Thermoanaerobaculia bacterium]|nr:OmpA family protein [Thermoanaerobaculia bacterium]